jgi:RNA polymerase sigma-70 factor (ECF subfamily)
MADHPGSSQNPFHHRIFSERSSSGPRRAPNQWRMSPAPGHPAALPRDPPGGRTRPRPAGRRIDSDSADDDLVAAVVEGDQAALAEIYRRYAGAVWAVARRVCNDRVLAEDVSQTVFVDLWQRPGRFDPTRGRLRPWLAAQAHARAVDSVRSETARARRQEREGLLAPPAPPDVEAEVHVAALSDDVRKAVDSLEPSEREAIMLSYFGGHSYRETAELLGAPEGTVKTRIRRGLMGLRRALEAQGVTP